jgi:hypothetical protein
VDYAKQMLDTHPRELDIDADRLAACIEACFDCAQACQACADACLGEDDVAELVKCIRVNLDCADVCAATGNVVSRQTEPDATLSARLLEACRRACHSCGDECDRHAQHHEHCRVCSEACRRCEEACERLLAAMS